MPINNSQKQPTDPQMLLGYHLRKWFSLSGSFNILGLKTTSRMEDVKKKYYQLAKKHHPDVNKSDQNSHHKFTEITKAYKDIVDNYDQEGGFYEAKNKQNSQKQQEKPFSAESKSKNQKRQKTRAEQTQYEDFYDYDNFFKQSKKFRKPKVGQDIYININIALQESIVGVEKNYSYTLYSACSSCATKKFTACFSCGGKGQIYDRLNREKVRCEYCSGKGFKNECLECLGASYVLREATDKIYIERGTKDKTILKVERKGHNGYKAGNGDLFITVLVQESQKFKIDGNNVHSEHELDYVTAVCGGNTSVETASGMKNVEIKPGTQSGAEIRIFNAGLKSPYSKRLGDHIVRIKIKVPGKPNEKQKRLFKELD